MSGQLYTTAEIVAMSTEDLAAARDNGFVKPLSPEEAAAQQRIGEATFGEGYRNPTTPGGFPDAVGDPFRPAAPFPPQDPYAVTTWGTDLYDFVVPSGQRCQMRRLRPERLLGTGLLDKMTRLPGFAEEQIRKAEGQPPVAAMPTGEQLESVQEVLNELLPIVVVQPKIWQVPTPEQANDDPDLDNSERRSGRVYVDQVDLFDAIAIMNRATSGVSKLDNFREES